MTAFSVNDFWQICFFVHSVKNTNRTFCCFTRASGFQMFFELKVNGFLICKACVRYHIQFVLIYSYLFYSKSRITPSLAKVSVPSIKSYAGFASFSGISTISGFKCIILDSENSGKIMSKLPTFVVRKVPFDVRHFCVKS